MRFAVLHRPGDTTTLAAQRGAEWIDLTRAHADYAQHVDNGPPEQLQTVLDLAIRGLLTRAYYRRIIEFSQRHGRVTQYVIEPPYDFALPLRPPKIVAIGKNYAAHAAELESKVPDEPLFFHKSPTACIGPNEPIVLKDWYGRVDHEGEIAVIIGKTCKDLTQEKARDVVAGYTLLNDVTARDMQKQDRDRGYPWYRCKNIDTFCPVGPTVTLADALSWPFEEDIETRVNGEVRQQSNTRKFVFSIPRLLEEITRYQTLEPGDLIATGTPEGVSPLVAGDRVCISSPELGVLENPVV